MGKNDDGPAARISAEVVEGWLESLNGEDPVRVLNAVMNAIGHLPTCAEDFLGAEVCEAVQRVRDDMNDDTEEGDEAEADEYEEDAEDDTDAEGEEE